MKDLGQVGVYLTKGLARGLWLSLEYPIAWGTPESGTPATRSISGIVPFSISLRAMISPLRLRMTSTLTPS